MRTRILLSTLAACAALAQATHQQSITANTVDTVLKVINDNTGGSGYAIVARSVTANGTAIRGLGTGTNGTGVWGNGTGSLGPGVYGVNSSGKGVWGTSAGGQGVYGEATGSGGIGVEGKASHASGTYGVQGTGPGAGVHGTSSVGNGVYGTSSAAGGYGVLGISAHPGPTGISYGVRGEGVLGGVQGLSPGGVGVVGEGAYGMAGSGFTGVQGGTGSAYGTGVEALTFNDNTKAIAAYPQGAFSFGVYSQASSDTGSYAGYFDGNVIVTGDCDPCSPSDARFKKNVRPIDKALAQVMALKPRAYEMKSDEYRDRIHLPRGTQFGLIAQDVEAVLPELVHPVSLPARLNDSERKNKVRKDPVNFKAVDYKDLIPVLIGAIQELQAEVQALKEAR